MRKLLILVACLCVAGCATTGDRAGRDPRDPYENFNRGVFAFNDGVDKAVVKPVSTVYRTVTPVPARRGISRVFANFMEPLHFINNLLQGKPKRAMNSLGRFVINTTIGVGGLADHATGLGLPDTSEDFGQTFATWGARNSPYVVLPLLGPSTVRDAAGTAINFVADPLQITLDEVGASGTVKTGATVTRIIDARSRLTEQGVDAVLETSADSYATARDGYFQRRAAQIADEPTAAPADQLSDEQQQRLLDEAIESNPAANPDPAEDPPMHPEPQPETPPATPAAAGANDARLPFAVLDDSALAGIDY